jgi:hypothetical protein
MAGDDGKTKSSAAPKNEIAVKKEVAAKQDESRPKDKTASDVDLSKPVRDEKAASSTSNYSRARAKNRFQKLIRITGTQFTGKRKRRSSNWSQWSSNGGAELT